MKKKQKMRKKANNLTLMGLILICLGLLGLVYTINNNVLSPDYAPGTIDTNAIKEEDNGDKMNASSGGAVSLFFSNIVAVNKKTKTAKLYFKNPGKSRENIVLQLIVNQNGTETLIAESDLIPAGYAIYKLNLKKNLNLINGGYDGIFRLSYYDEENNKKEIVDTEIEVSIEVE